MNASKLRGPATLSSCQPSRTLEVSRFIYCAASLALESSPQSEVLLRATLGHRKVRVNQSVRIIHCAHQMLRE
jgi:hypothetical protein